MTRLPVALGLAMAAVPLVASRTPIMVLLSVAAALFVVGAALRRTGADGAAAVAAAGAAAVGVLSDAPYAAAACLAVGVLAYAYLAVRDVGRRTPEVWGLSVTVTALAGGSLAGVVLVAAALAPELPGWSVAVGAVVLLSAAVIALHRPAGDSTSERSPG